MGRLFRVWIIIIFVLAGITYGYISNGNIVLVNVHNPVVNYDNIGADISFIGGSIGQSAIGLLQENNYIYGIGFSYMLLQNATGFIEIIKELPSFRSCTSINHMSVSCNMPIIIGGAYD